MEKAGSRFVEQLRQQHADVLTRIAEANQDLNERARELPVRAEYDLDDDTLILAIGEEQEALSPSVDNELFLRVDPDTLKIIGVELLHFSDHLRDHSAVSNFVLHLLEQAKVTQLTVAPDPEGTRQIDLSEDVRSLAVVER